MNALWNETVVRVVFWIAYSVRDFSNVMWETIPCRRSCIGKASLAEFDTCPCSLIYAGTGRAHGLYMTTIIMSFQSLAILSTLKDGLSVSVFSWKLILWFYSRHHYTHNRRFRDAYSGRQVVSRPGGPRVGMGSAGGLRERYELP